MKADRWKQIDEVFHAALEREPDRRAAFIDQACAGDQTLLEEVESLIRSHEQAEGFIESPAADLAAEILASDQDKLAGWSIGPYRILKLLGVGGMGEVYLAEDTRLGRRVAVKLLPAEATRDAERLSRFEREARAASALNHPNIITIHEIGQADSTNFIVTEFVEGHTLRQQLSGTRMKLGEALDVAIQAASALEVAHKAGIVHRDIKPANIMLRADGLIKVLDFGLAKLTETHSVDGEASTRARLQTRSGVIMGTVTYMSPEQARGLVVDSRSDIFSLGVVTYEMLAGRVPFEGETTSDVIVSILEREPPPILLYAPEAPAELDRILKKALAKDRSERYQTALGFELDLKELKQDLEANARLHGSVLRRPDVTASSPTLNAKRFVQAVKRHKSVAVALAALLIGVSFVLFLFSRPSRALTEKDSIVLADFTNATGDTVFDDTLKLALAVHLEQSPFLNILSDQRVRETLRYMNRSADERVTKEIAREICERLGIKALLAGSISSLGSHYVIGLEAVNAQSGDTIGREQIEVGSKEQVLTTLGAAASRLREKLGESLSSIQKFDAPVEEATTSSFEALKAFSLGEVQRLKGQYPEAIPFYRRAIELDENFALAHARLASMYSNTRQLQLAADASLKAFQLRERVSEREKLYISYNYYANVTREFDKQIEELELLKKMYVRDPMPHNSLAYIYLVLGPPEQAVEEAHEAIQLDPKSAAARGNLASALLSLNRFDEAREVLAEAVSQKTDSLAAHVNLYTIAFVKGDQAAMNEQLDWAAAKSYDHEALYWQGRAAAFSGQIKKARELYIRATPLAKARGMNEHIAGHMLTLAWTEAAMNSCRHVKEDVEQALSLARNDFILGGAASAFIMCDEPALAQDLIEELAKQNPKDTRVNMVLLPTTKAAIQYNHGNSSDAIKLLHSTSRFEFGSYFPFWAIYTRAQSYLRAREGARAMQEFQKIIDHRGIDAFSPLYPLAHLGQARANVLMADITKARRSYEDFFALWKDADPDIPILIEAKKEYEKLRQ
jgi:eukaryotic-like serine/threonine-protein kinase